MKEVPVYVCQRCGEECDDGDRDWAGRHAGCGGELDPAGVVEIDDDEEEVAGRDHRR